MRRGRVLFPPNASRTSSDRAVSSISFARSAALAAAEAALVSVSTCVKMKSAGLLNCGVGKPSTEKYEMDC